MNNETAVIDEACPSQLNTVFMQAATARTPEQVAEATNTLRNLQGQICKHVFRLSTDHGIKLMVNDPDVDLNEAETSDLITFLTGVGASCQDVIEDMARVQGT